MEAVEEDVKGILRTESHRYVIHRHERTSLKTICARFLSVNYNADGLAGALRTSTPENIEAVLSRGQALWNSIYAPHEVKLYGKLGSYHPDFICASAALSPSSL